MNQAESPGAPRSDQADATTRGRLVVVGIGASAGGLEATSNLLRSLPEKGGLAFIVVHHLDRTHESNLADLLGRTVAMPVTTARDGDRVEPDHVYVLAENADLRVEEGVLRLEPRPGAGRLHLPIDRFFRSLAVDRACHAVGVILSGTGSDGTDGVMAIKAEGGITFAQDGSAKFDGMPKSAVAAGCIDFVLPPEGIARELARIGGHLAAADDEAKEEEDLLVMLRRASGIDFVNYKRSTVRRRIQRRVLLHRLGSLREYVELARQNRAELDALREDLLIHVTSFFRDPEAFDVLKAEVFPRLLSGRAHGDPIRIWVPGCSTGEEVYSIAIALLEFLADAGADYPIKIFGTDVSQAAIERARAGTYARHIEADVPPARLERGFVKVGDDYKIQKHIRAICVFAQQDVTRDPPFSSVDLISCRNVMIYLGPALQGRVFPVFHAALKETGFLLLGAAEGITAWPGFTPIDAGRRIYARTAAPPARPLEPFDARRSGDTPRAAGQGSTQTSTQLEIQREADQAILTEYSPPGVIVTEDLVIIQFRGLLGAFLEPMPGTASLDLLRMAREELRVDLRQVIDEARRTGVAARTAGGRRRTGQQVDLEVVPFVALSSRQRFFAVLFRSVTPALKEAPAGGAPAAAAEPADGVERSLQAELASTRDYLQSVIEQLEAGNEELQASNEEVVASNEELQSTNEELLSAKEELQSTNEELSTVNEQLSQRILESTRLNDDLVNVLTSAAIPIVILGRDGRVRRVTPAASKLWNLLATDVGRPLSDVVPKLRVPDLGQVLADVLERLTPIERDVQDDEGRWYHVTVRPYRTLDDRIDGTVIAVFDIDGLKKSEALLAEARVYAENIIDAVWESLVVLDDKLRVRSANRSFYQMFGLSPDETLDKNLSELGGNELNTRALARVLEELTKDGLVDDLRLELELPKIGRRVVLLNGRRISRDGRSTPWILLALADITLRVREEEEALQRSEIHEMLASAAEPLLMCDPNGRIVFANSAASSKLGYAPDELLGLSIEDLVPERLREQHRLHRGGYMRSPVPRQMGSGLELFAVRKDGVEVPVEVALSTVQAPGGPFVVAVVSDVSKRKEAEQRIREYQTKLQAMAFDAAAAEKRERRRIAADLHDRIGQSLALAQMKVASARASASGEVQGALDEAVALLEQAIEDTRSVMFDLSPTILYDLGLPAALTWLAEQLEQRHALHVEIDGDKGPIPGLEDEVAAVLFRAVRELLMNVIKHAGAASAKVSLRALPDEIRIEVSDAGRGFEPPLSRPASGQAGFGLFSVREQVSHLGGAFEVHSAPGEGTRVSLSVPFGERKGALKESTP